MCSSCGMPLHLVAGSPTGPVIVGGPAGEAKKSPDMRRVTIVVGALAVVVALLFVVKLTVGSTADVSTQAADSSGALSGQSGNGQSPLAETSPSTDPVSTTSAPASGPVTLPPEAVICPVTYTGPSGSLGNSARGNDVTSCPFSEKVRQAYVESGSVGSPVVVQANSPVTHLDYEMSCEGTAPVVCTGGNNAIVYIF